MSRKGEAYSTGEVTGEDVRGYGVEDSVPSFWHQMAEKAKELVPGDHFLKVRLKDRDGEDHDLELDDVDTVEPDEDVDGGYNIRRRNGVKIGVIAATILGAGAGIVAYKKKQRKD